MRGGGGIPGFAYQPSHVESVFTFRKVKVVISVQANWGGKFWVRAIFGFAPAPPPVNNDRSLMFRNTLPTTVDIQQLILLDWPSNK